MREDNRQRNWGGFHSWAITILTTGILGTTILYTNNSSDQLRKMQDQTTAMNGQLAQMRAQTGYMEEQIANARASSITDAANTKTQLDLTRQLATASQSSASTAIGALAELKNQNQRAEKHVSDSLNLTNRIAAADELRNIQERLREFQAKKPTLVVTGFNYDLLGGNTRYKIYCPGTPRAQILSAEVGFSPNEPKSPRDLRWVKVASTHLASASPYANSIAEGLEQVWYLEVSDKGLRIDTSSFSKEPKPFTILTYWSIHCVYANEFEDRFDFLASGQYSSPCLIIDKHVIQDPDSGNYGLPVPYKALRDNFNHDVSISAGKGKL